MAGSNSFFSRSYKEVGNAFSHPVERAGPLYGPLVGPRKLYIRRAGGVSQIVYKQRTGPEESARQQCIAKRMKNAFGKTRGAGKKPAFPAFEFIMEKNPGGLRLLPPNLLIWDPQKEKEKKEGWFGWKRN